MTWKVVILAFGAGASMASGCSNPPAPEPEPDPSNLEKQSVSWEPPIVARTPNQDVLGYMAAGSGVFEIIDGCLSFDVGELNYTPVFPKNAPLVFSRTGFSWGGREIRFGEQVTMGGGQAPRGLEINEEAKRKCPAPFTVINNYPPQSKEDLDAILARRKPPVPKAN